MPKKEERVAVNRKKAIRIGYWRRLLKWIHGGGIMLVVTGSHMNTWTAESSCAWAARASSFSSRYKRPCNGCLEVNLFAESLDVTNVARD